jgi:large subunit ribosomal protein L10
LAISRDKKESMVAEYDKLIKSSKAIIISKYGTLTMPQLDKVRTSVRASKGEFHVTKNTLLLKVLADNGYSVPEAWLTGQTGVAFAFNDAAATAKAMGELAKEFEAFKTIGGAMDKKSMDATSVKALADLPPIETIRAQIIGALQAPSANIVGVLNSAVGSVMFALQAKIDKETPA